MEALAIYVTRSMQNHSRNSNRNNPRNGGMLGMRPLTRTPAGSTWEKFTRNQSLPGHISQISNSFLVMKTSKQNYRNSLANFINKTYNKNSIISGRSERNCQQTGKNDHKKATFHFSPLPWRAINQNISRAKEQCRIKYEFIVNRTAVNLRKTM